MDTFQNDTVILAKSVNTVVKHASNAESVDLEFLLEHWDAVTNAAKDTVSALKDGDDVATVANAVAQRAVEQELLHSSLLEHAVLLATFKVMNGVRVDDGELNADSG